MAMQASIVRNSSIGGKNFNQSTTFTGGGVVVKETTVPVAVAGSVTGLSAVATNITAATWASGVATFTSTAHGLHVGQVVTVASVDPTGYNGTYVVASVPTSSTFTVALASDPTSYNSGGTATARNTVTVPNNSISSGRVDIYWTISGVTYIHRGATVTSAIGNALYLTGGAGTTLPAIAQVVQVCVPTELPFTATGDNAVVIGLSTDTFGTFVFTQSDGSTEIWAQSLPAGVSYQWDNNNKQTNPVAGGAIGQLYFSHNDTTAIAIMSAGMLLTTG